MNQFERALRQRAGEEPEAEVLVAQWEIDRRLLASALQSVQALFGHYSRHDESHSSTILTQIARVLGPERVATLSATDLWLLLEAAYHHDLGMVVPDVDAREWMSNGALRAHAEKLTHHIDPEYQSAAATVLGTHDPRTMGEQWPFEVKRHLTLILADYARTLHPSRASEIAATPGLIGLGSPRVLIPRRLFTLLGRICALHGASFQETFRIQQVEQGIGTDDAHPRFVAYMLRIGDLLDLDDGRFCPVMKSTFGVLPQSSKAHERKHASITRLLVHPTRIEVEASCVDEEAFDEADRWLAMLRDELRDLSACWADVAPHAKFGSLPTLGTVKATLEGYVLLDGSRRPRFEVDRESFLELAQGKNLYSDRLTCIREMLQNAVDATHLRAWACDRAEIEEVERKRREHGVNPLPALDSILARYPIQVVVEKTSGGTGSTRLWRIQIRDRGVGIARADVPFIQQIGRSHRNPRRLRARTEMPEWLRPTGTFGIGLQSAFLLTERVTIVSRAWDSADVLELQLRRGKDGASDGLLVREAQNPDVLVHGGSLVEFVLETAAIPPRVSGSALSSEMHKILANHDPITDDELPFEAARVRHHVRAFAHASSVPIFVNTQPCPKYARDDSDTPSVIHYDEENIEIRLTPSLNHGSAMFYRGVKLEERVTYPYLSVDVDIRRGNAREILQLSRERLSDHGEDVLDPLISSALGRAMTKYLTSPVATVDSDTSVAAALWVLRYGDANHRKLAQPGYWRACRMFPDGPSLGDLYDARPFALRLEAYNDHRPRDVKWHPEEPRLVVSDDTHLISDELMILLAELGSRFSFNGGLLKPHRALPNSECRLVNEYIVGIDDIDPLPDGGLRYALEHEHHGRMVGGRFVLPCPKRFQKLAIERKALRSMWIGSMRRSFEAPLMVSPFFHASYPQPGQYELRELSKLVRWVQERVEQPASLYEIASSYCDFIRHSDSLVRDAWGSRVAYDVESALSALRREFPE